MIQVVGIRFKKAGKVYYFDPGAYSILAGTKVVVETARGVEYGDVAVGPKEVSEDQVVQPLKKVLRVGTEKDASTAAENKRREREAFSVAQKKIETHGLDMNLVDVEYTFDGSKNIFYFTAEGRVDFRELVRDLASIFRTRIEMRQIGVRDEAKLLGGIGPCGRILCCTSFLGDFAPVSIRMAKDQNLSLNPSKISGLCGRLMCCLRYEQDTYEAAKKDPTLSPGYSPPIAVGAELEPRVVEDEDDQSARRPGLRSSDSGFGARIAQAIADPIRRSERPTRERSPGWDKQPNRSGAGAPSGQPKSHGSQPIRRDGPGERPYLGPDRRLDPEEKSLQPLGQLQPRKVTSLPVSQGPKPQGQPQQTDKTRPERHGRNRHRGNRSNPGPGPQGAPGSQGGPERQQ